MIRLLNSMKYKLDVWILPKCILHSIWSNYISVRCKWCFTPNLCLGSSKVLYSDSCPTCSPHYRVSRENNRSYFVFILSFVTFQILRSNLNTTLQCWLNSGLNLPPGSSSHELSFTVCLVLKKIIKHVYPPSNSHNLFHFDF